jgi:hypothetical protein
MAARQPSWKTNKVLLFLDHLQSFIVGTSNKDAWHDAWVFDFTYFFEVTELKVQNGTDMGTFDLLLKVTDVNVQNGTIVGTFR